MQGEAEDGRAVGGGVVGGRVGAMLLRVAVGVEHRGDRAQLIADVVLRRQRQGQRQGVLEGPNSLGEHVVIAARVVHPEGAEGALRFGDAGDGHPPDRLKRRVHRGVEARQRLGDAGRNGAAAASPPGSTRRPAPLGKAGRRQRVQFQSGPIGAAFGGLLGVRQLFPPRGEAGVADHGGQRRAAVQTGDGARQQGQPAPVAHQRRHAQGQRRPVRRRPLQPRLENPSGGGVERRGVVGVLRPVQRHRLQRDLARRAVARHRHHRHAQRVELRDRLFQRAAQAVGVERAVQIDRETQGGGVQPIPLARGEGDRAVHHATSTAGVTAWRSTIAPMATTMRRGPSNGSRACAVSMLSTITASPFCHWKRTAQPS